MWVLSCYSFVCVITAKEAVHCIFLFKQLAGNHASKDGLARVVTQQHWLLTETLAIVVLCSCDRVEQQWCVQVCWFSALQLFIDRSFTQIFKTVPSQNGQMAFLSCCVCFDETRTSQCRAQLACSSSLQILDWTIPRLQLDNVKEVQSVLLVAKWFRRYQWMPTKSDESLVIRQTDTTPIEWKQTNSTKINFYSTLES